MQVFHDEVSMRLSSPIGPLRPESCNIRRVGQNLHRPECVLTTANGAIFTSDWTHGIARTSPDGVTTAAAHPSVIAQGLLPNGFAITRDQSFLFANLSEAGGVWKVGQNNAAEPYLMEVDGRHIPPAHFVWIDDMERVWITVSAKTRAHKYFTKSEKEGFIALVDKRGARIVADGLTWTNELRISADGAFLYVNETFASRTARFNLDGSGNLSNKHEIAMPPGTFPDGMALDEEGGIWTICVVSGRLIRIDPSGRYEVVMEDFIPAHLNAILAAYGPEQVTRELIVGSKGRHFDNPTSIAFGGSDQKTLYFGSISATHLVAIDAPVAGAKPAHWNWL